MCFLNNTDVLFTKVKRWKQHTNPSAEAIHKIHKLTSKQNVGVQWSIIPLKKKKEVLMRATTWVELEHIMLSKTS